MRVLLVTGRYYGIGGGEVLVRELSQRLRKYGIQPIVIAHKRVKYKKNSKKRNKNTIPIYYTFYSFHIPKLPASYIPFYAAEKFVKIMDIIKKFDINIIHALNELEYLGAYYAGKLTKRPVILRIGAIWEYVASNEIIKIYGMGLKSKIGLKFLSWLENFALRNASIISVIDEMKASFLINKYDIEPEKIVIIPHGVDTVMYDKTRYKKDAIKKREQLGIKTKRVILFVGRLAPIKGVELLLNAMPMVIRKIPNVMLIIVGGDVYGGEINYYYNKVLKMGISKHVMFVGEIPRYEIPMFLAISDAFVYPSMEIGLGFACLEALSSGVPVITTKYVLGSRNIGEIIDELNVKNLADSIIKILSDSEYADKLGKIGRAYVLQNHTWDKVIKSYVDLYRKVVHDNGRK